MTRYPTTADQVNADHLPQHTQHAEQAVHHLVAAICEMTESGEVCADFMDPAWRLLTVVAQRVERLPAVAGPLRVSLRGQIKRGLVMVFSHLPPSWWRPASRALLACWPGFRDA